LSSWACGVVVSRSSGDASTGFSTDQVNADSAVTSQPVNSVPNMDSEYHLKVHSLPSSKFSCTIFAQTPRANCRNSDSGMRSAYFPYHCLLLGMWVSKEWQPGVIVSTTTDFVAMYSIKLKTERILSVSCTCVGDVCMLL
jgi:hypothetical protein